MKILIRDIDDETHKQARFAALKLGLSLNKFVIEAIKEKINQNNDTKASLLPDCERVLRRALACIQSGDVLPENARADIKDLLIKLAT